MSLEATGTLVKAKMLENEKCQTILNTLLQ